MNDDEQIAAMRARPVVELLRSNLARYDATVDEFRWAARRGAGDHEHRHAFELREQLERDAVVLGDLARRALAEVMIRDRPQRTVRLLGRATDSHVDLPVLAARDWIAVGPDGLDRQIPDPQPPPAPGRLNNAPERPYAVDLRYAIAAAIDAEIDVASWLGHLIRQVLARRGSTPDVLRDGRPITLQTEALYALAGGHPAIAPGAPRVPLPPPAIALAAEPHTTEATDALATALAEEYDFAWWIGHQINRVLDDRSIDAPSLVAADPTAAHAIAYLQLVTA